MKDSVENSRTPRLLQIVGKREYWVQIGDKHYKYLIDGAFYSTIKTLKDHTEWEWFNFLKNNCYKEWEVIK